jgi:hypothetical protein
VKNGLEPLHQYLAIWVIFEAFSIAGYISFKMSDALLFVRGEAIEEFLAGHGAQIGVVAVPPRAPSPSPSEATKIVENDISNIIIVTAARKAGNWRLTIFHL